MTNRPMPPPPPPPSGRAAPPPPSPAAGTASRPSPPSAAPAPPPPRPPVGRPPAPATSPPRRSTPSSPAVPPRTGPSQAAGTRDFVDGGSALLHRPYRTDEWAPVRKAWWWHTVGMIWLLPFYSVVALTLWQRPSRQSLGRRALWSTAMTVAALSVIGLPAFVAFSRRWYWLYRVDGDPELRGVGARQDGPASGYLAWFASTGASLTDAIVGGSPAPPPPPPLPDQWQALVTEAAAGEARLRAAASRATGPSAAAINRAAQEADQAT